MQWHDARALAEREPEAGVMLVVPVMDDAALGGSRCIAAVTLGFREAGDAASPDR